jgi:hypothetical protein
MLLAILGVAAEGDWPLMAFGAASELRYVYLPFVPADFSVGEAI